MKMDAATSGRTVTTLPSKAPIETYEARGNLIPLTAPALPQKTDDKNNDTDNLPAKIEPPSPYHDLIGDVDVRNISPRRMVELAMDLYVSGAINWNESALMAFQPELQPDYDKTVGALTGEPAEPDRPRDFVEIWEQRLTFEKKYNTIDSDAVTKSQRIVDVLHAIDSPPLNVVA